MDADSATTQPTIVPGRIEAENFDTYYDTTANNIDGAYRSTGVDLQANRDTESGFHVAWIENDEWLEYPIRVANAGIYEIQTRVASATGNGMFNIELVGHHQTDAISIENTGGWNNWVTKTTALGLIEPDDFTLRVQVQAGGFNLNWLDIIAADQIPTPGDNDNQNPGTTDPGLTDPETSNPETSDPEISNPSTDIRSGHLQVGAGSPVLWLALIGYLIGRRNRQIRLAGTQKNA